MHKITNILRTQAIDGRTAIWSECEKPTRSRESTGTESPRCPYEKGQVPFRFTLRRNGNKCACLINLIKDKLNARNN